LSPPWPQTTPKNGPACQTTKQFSGRPQLYQDRGIKTKSVSTREEALKLLAKKIPPGAEVMTGASATLDEIGFLQLLKLRTHQWKNLKTEITGEKDPVRQRELRVLAAAAQYFVGSAHAIAGTREIVVASASGSQIPAYAYSSNNVIWVVGAQKIASLDEGLRRVRESACQWRAPI